MNQFNEQPISEEKHYKANIQDLLTRFKQQIQHIEVTSIKISSLTCPPSPGSVETPDVEPEMRTKPPFKMSTLTKLSGIEPVPKGEISYEQFKF